MDRTFERRSTVDKGNILSIVCPVPTTECQSVENSCDATFDRCPLSSHVTVQRSRLYISIYIYAFELVLPINFVFPIPREEEFFVMQIFFGRGKIGTRSMGRVFYPRISFCSLDRVHSPSLPPVLRGKQLRVKGREKEKKKDKRTRCTGTSMINRTS